MIALGCLLPLALPVIGALAGDVLWNATAALWGAIGGFILGCAIAGPLAWLFLRAKED